jgi:glycosyltransferase involved in cell wall biosynthesis
VRIAHVVPRGEQPSSGVLTVITSLSGALAERGHQVEVWQLHHWDRERYQDVSERFEPAGASAVSALADVPMPRLGAAAAGLASRRGIELVHLHGGFNPSNTFVARRLGAPFVFSPHSAYDPVSLRRNRRRKLLYRALFERSMIRRAALVVGLTDDEAADIRAFAPVHATAVIENGVAAPPEGVDPTLFRSELGLSEDARLAVFVGRLDVFRKGLDRVVEGVAAAPRWIVALVGPRFRGVARLEARISELGIEDRVLLVGERRGAALYACLAAADVFLLVSRWEGLSVALLEALSLGIPAVVSPAVDRTIGVEAAGAGWVVNDDGLTAALERLETAGRDELLKRRTSAWSLARRYDWSSVAERYEAAYEGVVRRRRAIRD